MSLPDSSYNSFFDNPFAEKNHQLPDGSWVSLQIKSNIPFSRWTYVWICFVKGAVRPAWYRIFPAGTPPPEWKPLKPAGKVDKQTGAEEPDSENDAQEIKRANKGKIGVARKLRPGRYIVQSKIRVGTEDIELTSIEFQVGRNLSEAGWG